MSKYNVALELDTDNSLRWINECLADNSTVLEFGPAHGRLTRHLVENRNCIVDVVEIDAESGKDAAKFARYSLLGQDEGNIEKFNWLEKFSRNKYDYIIFADVLEHLYNPEFVLENCKKILAKNGKIVFSVPNIAYNGLILNLLRDHFDYTPTGLLDDTHIRFFTYNTIVEMMTRLNLYIVYQNAVQQVLGTNEVTGRYEQFLNFNSDIIKQHSFGEVYQFVIAVQCVPGNVIDKLTPISERVKENFKNYVNPSVILEEKNKLLEEESRLLEEKSRLLEEVLHSRSWRITSPLRFSFRAFHYIGRFFDILLHEGAKPALLKAKRKIMQQTSLENVAQTKELKPTYLCSEGYHSIYQKNQIISGHALVKTIAFYLPQYHTFPENDLWWGKGFTEWTNTKKAVPRFFNHYQPREPHDDIGYYNLANVESLRKQVKLAQEHHIYGFCFYYYWFSGKRLMEKPVDLFLENPDIDFPFCLCWANENWTRTWDGLNNNILIKQNHSIDDRSNFILDIKKYLLDKRYIRIKGKPVIIVYNPGQIPNVREVFKCWKRTAQQYGIGDILIWIVQSFNNTIKSLNLDGIVEQAIEFPPHFQTFGINLQGKSVNNEKGTLFNYAEMVSNIIGLRNSEKKIYRTVMLGWDNSARREKGYNVFDRFDLKIYYDWLKANVREAISNFEPEERFTFINAWNEWAEGTYLEPDKRYGYASINVTSKAILRKPFGVKIEGVNRNQNSRIAVQVHIYYDDLAEEVVKYTNLIGESFDLYVTTDLVSKANTIEKAVRGFSKANKFEIAVIDNRGRDVAPFILQMAPVIENYQYFVHLHTKRSVHSDFGDRWRKYLFSNLLGGAEQISTLLEYLDNNPKIGILYPNHFENIIPWLEKEDSNKPYINNLLKRLGIEKKASQKTDFPSGDMFWGRTKAVRQVFSSNLTIDDFPEEKGQLDGTIMHAIERCWCIIAENNGYESNTLDKVYEV